MLYVRDHMHQRLESNSSLRWQGAMGREKKNFGYRVCEEKKNQDVRIDFHSYLVDHTPNRGSVVTKDGLMAFSEAERFDSASMRVASAGKPPHQLNGQFRTPPRRRRTRHSSPPSLPKLN